MDPLVSPSQLSEFDGAPFSATHVDAASGAIRRECGWHIAPSVTETLTVDSDGGPVLLLPTLHLTSVTEVRSVLTETPTVLAGWRMSRAGMLSRGAGWPVGFGAVEVDLVHGYDACPPELLPIIADRTRRRVAQESLGSRSVSLIQGAYAPLDATLARFKLPPRP